MDFHVGQTFGDYTITGIVGAGGMGRIFKVEHNLTKRTEAMKVLSAELASDIQMKRFEREMRVLARLSHPNIAVLHNAIHSEKQLILLMELIEGRTLESLLRGARLPIDTGIEYIKQVLLALQHAHQQGVVHRDVTPANVIIAATGQVKLTDFGLSKSYGDPVLTNCGEVLGSLPYMAPEQIKGATQPDRRSDLYSVGAMLYELLTGQRAFGTSRRLAPVLTDSEAEPRPPSQVHSNLSPEWDRIIRQALAREPAHRYRSADEFLEAIAQIDDTRGLSIPIPRPRNFAVGAVMVGGLVVALAASPVFNRMDPAPAAAIRFVGPLHIAPPPFATLIPPPPVAKPAKVARLTQTRIIEPPEPSVTATPIADVPAPPKKTFWSKLNVFKKKRSVQE